MYFEAFVLMFAVIAAYNCRLGLYAIIFLMPAYLFRYTIFGIPTTILEVMIYIFFAFWFMKEGKSEKPFDKLFALFKKERILSCGIILLFLGLLISTAYSSDIRASLGIVKGWFIDPFLLFLVMISCIKEKREIKGILSVWVLSGFTVAIIAIGYLIVGRFTFDGRLSAFYLSPNHLAMYLSPPLLIVLGYLISKASFNTRDMDQKSDITKQSFLKKISDIPACRVDRQYLIFAVIILIPIYFTYSYGAFLGISAGLFYLLGRRIFGASLLKKKKSYPAAILVILFLVLILGYGKIDQIENSNERSSFHSRLMIWGASVEMIKESPFVGIGPGTFQEKYLSLAENRSEPYLEWAVPQPHNIFLAFYLQTGLLGFIGFILILIWFFHSSLKRNILASLMIYFLFHGLIDTTYWKNDLAIMFWIILGLSVFNLKNFGDNKNL